MSHIDRLAQAWPEIVGTVIALAILVLGYQSYKYLTTEREEVPS